MEDSLGDPSSEMVMCVWNGRRLMGEQVSSKHTMQTGESTFNDWIYKCFGGTYLFLLLILIICDKGENNTRSGNFL